jgi:hypothetical protein
MRLVGTHDPTHIFKDLDALRAQNKVPKCRAKIGETFARIPHDRGLALYRSVGGPAWAILIELDRLILKARGKNPIELKGSNLNIAGMSPYTKRRGLNLLATAGVIEVQSRRGKPPLVLHTWYPHE